MVTPGMHMPTLVEWLDKDDMAGDLKELDLSEMLKILPTFVTLWRSCTPGHSPKTHATYFSVDNNVISLWAKY